MRAFDSSDPGTRAVMARRPQLLDRLAPDDAEHFAQVRALLDAAGIAYELDPTLVLEQVVLGVMEAVALVVIRIDAGELLVLGQLGLDAGCWVRLLPC